MFGTNEEWGPCSVCGRVTWIYSANGLTIWGRCLQCWRNALNVGLIPARIYGKIRKRAVEREI